MITVKQIEEIVAGAIFGTDIFIVEITVTPGNSITVRIDNQAGITIDNCIQISRHIESLLDRDVEDFALEVTSAGLGQPFKVIQQYHKIVGKKIQLVLKDGRKLIETLEKVDDKGITISNTPPKSKRKVTKLLPASEQEIMKSEQTNSIELAWDEIKSATEHINFQ